MHKPFYCYDVCFTDIYEGREPVFYVQLENMKSQQILNIHLLLCRVSKLIWNLLWRRTAGLNKVRTRSSICFLSRIYVYDIVVSKDTCPLLLLCSILLLNFNVSYRLSSIRKCILYISLERTFQLINYYYPTSYGWRNFRGIYYMFAKYHSLM